MKGMRSSRYQSCFPPPLPLVEPFCMPSILSGPPSALAVDTVQTHTTLHHAAHNVNAALSKVYIGCKPCAMADAHTLKNTDTHWSAMTHSSAIMRGEFEHREGTCQ